jgi:putative 4-hydroxybenzoate polyprenyltransferase
MTSAAPVARFLTFIRFSHTVFAMPFALGAMLVAADGFPTLRLVLFIVLALVFARTAAMTFNRIADWDYDRRNPRTEGRHRLVPRGAAIAGCAISSALFLLVSAAINPLCLTLSPVALGLVFFYSLTKRFTHAAQFFLGLALSAAPVGAWLAVTGAFAWAPLVLALGVTLWVAGFDIIYATQDYEVDRREGLKSIVVWLGIPRALRFAQVLHALTWLCLVAFGWIAGLGPVYAAGVVLVLGFLVYEHRVARSLDVAAINAAFFRSNAWIGAVFLLSILIDRLA